MNYTFHWLPALRALPDMLRGALVTLEIAVLSMILGVSIGVLLALSSRSRWTGLRALASTWVELARNTPALFQIYMAYSALAHLASTSIAWRRLSSASRTTMRGILPKHFGAVCGRCP